MTSDSRLSWAGLLLRRLGGAAGTLLGVTLVTFLVVYRLPGDPAALLAGPRADPEVIANIRRELKLDQPLPFQYADYLIRLAHLDLGQSYVRREPVAEVIRRRLPQTLQLALAGWLCWLLFGTALGTWVAARPGRWREGALLGFSILGVSTPTFWVGLLLLYLFVTRWKLLPAGGSGTLRHLVLPLLALSFAGVAYYARVAHTTVRDALAQDYVRTARAKGLSFGSVVYRHALRNALLPLVTLAGADLAALLGGVVFTESVFDWKGMGQLAVESVALVDLPMILGVVLVSAIFVVLANLIVDLLYPLLDPRIR